MAHDDTIFALSSGPGVAGVAVIRVSGCGTGALLTALTKKPLPEPRAATLSALYNPKGDTLLDRALVLWFAGPNSFTGEDIAELHVHGGTAVVEGVLAALAGIEGVRAATAGEFTRRAFDNGKMDLTEAEGLADLIHAQTAAQREQALRQMDGALRKLYEGWRERIISHLAHLEADIDFPDEGLPEGVAGAVKPEIMAVSAEIEEHLSDAARGRAIRNGYRIVILGAPNVGKSTLLNALARSDVAIVSDEAGTTRDVIEIQLNLGGFPVRLVDTAGLRDGGGPVEQEGMRRAKAYAEDAELRLVLASANDGGLDGATAALVSENALLVLTKADTAKTLGASAHDHGQLATLVTSAKTGGGVEALLMWLTDHVVASMGKREAVTLTRLRHKEALTETVEHLTRFTENAGLDPVLAAEDVRMAVRALGSITGLVHVEDILDVVFSDFCIGK